jgi:hypothetical protein
MKCDLRYIYNKNIVIMFVGNWKHSITFKIFPYINLLHNPMVKICIEIFILSIQKNYLKTDFNACGNINISFIVTENKNVGPGNGGKA